MRVDLTVEGVWFFLTKKTLGIEGPFSVDEIGCSDDKGKVCVCVCVREREREMIFHSNFTIHTLYPSIPLSIVPDLPKGMCSIPTATHIHSNFSLA